VCQFAISEAISWILVIFAVYVANTSGSPLIARFGTRIEADAGTRTPDPSLRGILALPARTHG
jgi:hypothetical protein